jgi:hypothetical protein
LTGWYVYNTKNYTFYYSATEKKEIKDSRNDRRVISIKLTFDDCFWKASPDCYEFMRGLKFKNFISDKDWVFIDEEESYYKLTSRAKNIRLTALNKWYDERAKEEAEYKELKYFNQFVFEEVMIFLAMATMLYISENRSKSGVF